MRSHLQRMALPTAACALLVVLLTARCASAVDVRESTQYYKLSGKTVDELLRQMREKGPTDGSGVHWFAYTRWYIHWTYVFSRGASGCTLTSVNVTLQVIFTLPEWEEPRDAPASVRDKWGEFSRSLRVHENGHKAIALGAATRILEKISSLGTGEDCQELDRQANALGQRLLQEARGNELRYDHETNHGQTQGALLRN